MLFGLNGLTGRTKLGYRNWTGQWDPTQAGHLLHEFIETGFIRSLFAVELGNEIYGWV